MDKKQLKILVIDRQRIVAKLIKTELQKTGHLVSISNSIKAGLLRAEAFHFDLFVVNCGTQGKEGIDFANTIIRRNDYEYPAFLFTCYLTTKVDKRLLSFDHRFELLRLPLDKTELHLRIENLLKGDRTKNPAEKKEKAENSLPENPSKTSEKTGSAPGKVLLVEDNPLNQKVLGMFIGKLNFEYDVASNGQMAVDLAQKENYQYILMDIYMPGMDGTEATELIRKNEEEKNSHRARIIAITANESEESVKRCYDSGMDDYLVKPFTMEVLKEKLV